MLTHHLASSPRTWRARSPSLFDETSEHEITQKMADDFNGPGTDNEVCIPLLFPLMLT
jgi:hypothetical protein